MQEWIAPGQDPILASDAQSCASLKAELAQNPALFRVPSDDGAAPAVSISSDGDLVVPETGRPVTVSDRLSLHHLLERAVAQSSRR